MNNFYSNSAWQDCPCCGNYDRMYGGMCRKCGEDEDYSVELAQRSYITRHEDALNKRLDGDDAADETYDSKADADAEPTVTKHAGGGQNHE